MKISYKYHVTPVKSKKNKHDRKEIHVRLLLCIIPYPACCVLLCMIFVTDFVCPSTNYCFHDKVIHPLPGLNKMISQCIFKMDLADAGGCFHI